MTQKQYADMTTIVQFCRIFTDQMYQCLENSGLLKEGFQLTMHVGKLNDLPEGILKCEVELEKDILTADRDDYRSTRMVQFNIAGEGWRVYEDPLLNPGAIPSEMCFREKKVGEPETGKAGAKPYPPYDMWLGSDDYYSDVDGR